MYISGLAVFQRAEPATKQDKRWNPEHETN